MRAVIYLRQSLDRTGDGLAVARQEQDCRRLCAERGWTVTEVVSDNDVSATGGKPRPGYRRVLGMVDTGAVDVVVAWHLDRLTRKLSDLEEIIGLCERTGVKLATVSGDIDLSTDAGRLVGRILASVARGEVERKGARQRRAFQQAAEQGRPSMWSRRSFGYADDKVTPVPTEAAAIADACDQLLAGGSLRSIARQWSEAGHVPPQRRDSTWQAGTVRKVLLNPRIAGLSTYKDEIVGVGSWKPIVAEETWRALAALLTDPARTTNTGPRGVTTLLGGLARCACGANCYGGRSSHGHAIYRCERLSGGGGGHVARRAEPIDTYVADVVIERLSRPDAAELLVDRDRPDVDALRTEANALRARLESVAAEFAEGELTTAQLRVINEKIGTKLAAIESRMAEAGRLSVLGPLVRAEDVRGVWESLDLDRRRAVIVTLLGIVVHPAGRGRREFDPATVEISWRQR
jgi:DNA invertase Pin-like site-specific DNA recombinase